MSNIINADLKHKLQTGKIGVIADVDGSLTPPGNHPELLKYNDALVRTFDATCGAFMFLTNNDGRSISQVTKKIRRHVLNAIGHADAGYHFRNEVGASQFQFSIVSECATRIRRWAYGKEIIENSPTSSPINIKSIKEGLEANTAIAEIIKTKLSDGRASFQAKENTLCFNFVEGDNSSRQSLEALCRDIVKDYNLNGYDVITLLDSVEIIPAGSHKRDVLQFLHLFPEFDNKDFILMIGDTETDADVARDLHAQGRGAMIAVGDHVNDGDHVIQRVDNIHELMTLLRHISITVEANKKITFYEGARPIQPDHKPLAGPAPRV